MAKKHRRKNKLKIPKNIFDDTDKQYRTLGINIKKRGSYVWKKLKDLLFN